MRTSLFACLLLLQGSSGLLGQKWDTLAPIPESFTFPVVDVLGGKIHIMGGGGSTGATDHHYAYDPATNTWQSRAPVPYKAQQPAGATANGKLHFFGGGFPNSGSPLNDHYVYDPVSNAWSAAADLTAPRAIHYAVTLDNVLFSLAGQGMTNLCQTYDPVSNSWTTKNNLPDGAFFYGAHVATNGHIYRFCGGGYTAPNNKVHRYNPAQDNWTTLSSFPAAIHGLRGAAIGNKIYLAGGYREFLERDEVYIFDTETETLSTGTPLPLARNYHEMVALDSCIYVVGGSHAIDETVKFQLLRFCPYKSTSSAKEKSNLSASQLTARYLAGKLSIAVPESAMGKPAQLFLFDLTGKQLFSEKISTLDSALLEQEIGILSPAMYVLRLQTTESVYSGKIMSN